ncbi:MULTISPECIES: creatininase family protein [Microbacterium]|uniref:Creatininase family protein n=1 Tax=Microbacterium aquimaris TaxID=459816 RepID=A0ABU5N4C4_9MICO|nr:MULTISPECIES: creatininase family protein [Microbacterium]MAP62664.1 creatinine amidohydrolase [Microbacterium sp.]MDZ8160940.1 creatininase family protein [Microbacterium aquimaris]MDZ8172938.1 creatininase family protein [Microbacterium sp. KSW-48]MDZ8200931.1 creatininase family protein [Microbacterium sp. SSW1-59]MDZ8275156.1 creatininase family protein [Microbacterium aquimaris]
MTERPERRVPHLTEGDEDFRAKFRSWNLADLSYVDIEEYLKTKDTVLVPMASTEQHGPHLPLYTDTITAVEISSRISEQIGVLHTPPLWAGYSPQHMYGVGQGRGTITLRASTLLNLMNDVARSLIHHGFNRIIFINGHGSNTKVVDPVLRRLRYETGALISFVKPFMERYVGILEGLMENPPEETPGWHSSELETSQDLAWNPDLVRMERAVDTRAHTPAFLPDAFRKNDGMPDTEFEGYQYFTFPMDHHEFVENGIIGNPMRATAEKGEEAFRRYSEHVARGILELQKVDVDVHTREFIDRTM